MTNAWPASEDGGPGRGLPAVSETGAVARPVGPEKFATLIEVPGGPILADEPVEVGGGGAGATPYQLIAAALAACTSMTLRLYARRKGLTIGEVEVAVDHALVGGRDRFTRRLLFTPPIDAETRAKLIEIADKCPVHGTLGGGGAEIVTLSEDAPVEADPPTAHYAAMEQACGPADTQ